MYWIAIGPSENWKTTIQGKKIWGLVRRHQIPWNRVTGGDTLLFYATRPVQGLIGYGKIRSKKIDETPLWPQEVEAKHALWPLRLLLDIEFCLNSEQWETKRIPLPKGIFIPRGFQQVKDDLAKSAIEALRESS